MAELSDLVGKKLTGYKEYANVLELYFEGSIVEFCAVTSFPSGGADAHETELQWLVRTPESITSINQHLSPSDERELEQHRAWDDE